MHRHERTFGIWPLSLQFVVTREKSSNEVGQQEGTNVTANVSIPKTNKWFLRLYTLANRKQCLFARFELLLCWQVSFPAPQGAQGHVRGMCDCTIKSTRKHKKQRDRQTYNYSEWESQNVFKRHASMTHFQGFHALLKQQIKGLPRLSSINSRTEHGIVWDADQD